jgi:hypothetical protein
MARKPYMLFGKKMATLARPGRSDYALDKVIACITARVGPLANCRQLFPNEIVEELPVNRQGVKVDHICGQPLYREPSPHAGRGGVAGGSQFLPVGTLRRSSSKKFSRTVTLSRGLCPRSAGPSAFKTTAKRLPSGARSYW